MKKVKRMLGSICAATVLLSSIPTSGMVASANETPTANGVEFYDASGTKLEDAEYSLHGVEYVHDDITNQGLFVRLPEEEAIKISKEKTFTGDKEPSLFDKNGEWNNTVYSLARESAGGRIRFNTDSTTIKIEAQLYLHDFAHYDHGDSMKAAQLGFDVYVDTAEGSTYAGTVQGTPDVVKNADDKVTDITSNVVKVNDTITFDTAERRDITIYFPIVIETNSVKISVDEGSIVSEHVNDYEGEGRIVFYGSSITQGGAVTKPGNTYVNIVGRNLNREYIDFGMWGRCKGEETFAQYIGSLGDVSAFVLDYDHNNSNVDGLSNHYRFYELVRAEYPDIPIIMMTRPGSGIDNTKAQYPDDDYSWAAEMKAVIRQSYETAKAAGDENVHFVDGETFFGYSKAYMADGSHPNDAGQAKMAEVVTAVFEQIYVGKKNLCVVPSACDEQLLINEDFENKETGTQNPDGWEGSASGVDTWSANVIEETDGNKAYQMNYVRKSGGSLVTLNPGDAVGNNGSDMAVEMDVDLDKVSSVPELGIKIGENPCSSKTQKIEIRFRVYDSKNVVYFYDGTDGTNPGTKLDSTNITDQSFKDMYENGKVSYNIRVELRKSTYTSNTMDVSVLINGTHVAGYNFTPQDDFQPNHFRIFCYGSSNGTSNTVTIDNIKAYSLPKHTLSYVPETAVTANLASVKAHYACSKCHKQFLDEKGIIPVTYLDLVNVQGCMLFTDDFEDGAGKWTAFSSEYADDAAQIVMDDNGNSIYQLEVTRTTDTGSNEIHVREKEASLTGYLDYSVEMDTTLHQAENGGKWPSFSARMRVSNGDAHGYQVQIVPETNQWRIYLRDRTGQTAVSKDYTVSDDTLAASMATGKITRHIRIGVDTYVTDDDVTKVKFLICIGNNIAEEYEMTLDNSECRPTKMTLYAHTGTIVDEVADTFKVDIDNVMVYTDSHTISHVDATPSTNDEAGLKEHYACSVCKKKFSDEAGVNEVTNEQLAYAKLTDIICQTKTNATNSQNEDIRFLVYIDDYTKYQSVTFKITCSAGTGTAICKDVYTGVYAGGKLYTTEDIFGVDGYFATFILKNNTPADLEDTMAVVATWKALDGTETTKTRIVNISKERK